MITLTILFTIFVKGLCNDLCVLFIYFCPGKDMRIIVFAFVPKTKQVPYFNSIPLAYYFSMHAEYLRFNLWCLSFQKNEVFDVLRRYTKPANLWDLYAFSCDPSAIKNDSEPKRRLLREYFRLFRRSLPLQGFEEVSLCNEWWRLTRVNSSYSLCSTYPSELIVPRSIRYFHALNNNMW
jgi:myotubularin-related protein 1/2